MMSPLAEREWDGGGEPAVLRDGTTVTLRPMRDDDGDRLVSFHESLSPETQYRRFFSSHAHLSAREVDWFTHVDHARREAIVAVLDGEIVGVGRFDRIDGTVDAEVAFVVSDRFQGRGLGGVLMAGVAARASVLGIERLVAETMLHNDRMLAVFHHAGLPMSSCLVDGIVAVQLTLPVAG
jgi:RimJ/RimL family protein N-acetyltransferase